MTRILRVIAGSILGLIVSSSTALAQWGGGYGGWGHGPWMMGGGYGGGWFGGIFMIVFWIIVIIGIVFLIRWLVQSTRGGGFGSGESALDILKRRYANGEINKKEFEQKKKDLL
jgi:putative membrane protein